MPAYRTSSILLTIDVEDWFQVENFRQCVPSASWQGCELRVEKNTNCILDLLDSIQGSTSPGGGSPKATFFVLGWIARRLPHMVREIQARGHETASHGFYHRLCGEESVDDLTRDLIDSRKLLEDLTGAPVYGYRAPSFSVGNDILRVIEESGYLYDSSYNSFLLNKRYGRIEFPDSGRNGIAIRVTDRLYELPISNLQIGPLVLPWGGGGYFRLIPLSLFKQGVQMILNKEGAYLFYLHPWEIDPEQPVVREARSFYKFRHYANLDKTLSKMSILVDNFKECSFLGCHQYLTVHATNV
jgi:polysaccharide deacetylase family protein (PEP-CTERM system associated)